MRLAALERRARDLLVPPWFEAWRVRRTRRSLAPGPVPAPDGARRLWIDVSVISKHDAGTGIQRTVRAVASQLLGASPAGWEVFPVAATRKRSYATVTWMGGSAHAPVGIPLEARPGDVFLGLDFALDTVRHHTRQLSAFKRSGGELWFMMYDLLPAHRPDWFSDKLVVRYRKWLGILAGLADGFYCISPSVESLLREELAGRYGLTTGFRTEVLPLGWDLASSRPTRGVPAGFDALLRTLAQDPTALVVGTVEPRKGHSDVLAAFDLLWQRGCSYNLVIVGRPGWKTEGLQDMLRCHPQAGKRLFWLDDVSDEALERLYAGCHGVIGASHAEGFGLPLVEALGYGKPVLARDLPVFRVHEKQDVSYFPAAARPHELAFAVDGWLAARHRCAPGASTDMPTWADTAGRILSTLSGDRAGPAPKDAYATE